MKFISIQQRVYLSKQEKENTIIPRLSFFSWADQESNWVQYSLPLYIICLFVSFYVIAFLFFTFAEISMIKMWKIGCYQEILITQIHLEFVDLVYESSLCWEAPSHLGFDICHMDQILWPYQCLSFLCSPHTHPNLLLKHTHLLRYRRKLNSLIIVTFAISNCCFLFPVATFVCILCYISWYMSQCHVHASKVRSCSCAEIPTAFKEENDKWYH